MIRRLRFWFRTTFTRSGRIALGVAAVAVIVVATRMTAMRKRGGPVPDALVDAAGDCAG